MPKVIGRVAADSFPPFAWFRIKCPSAEVLDDVVRALGDPIQLRAADLSQEVLVLIEAAAFGRTNATLIRIQNDREDLSWTMEDDEGDPVDI